MTGECLEIMQSNHIVIPSMHKQTLTAIRHSSRLSSDTDRIPKCSLLPPLALSFLTAVRAQARWQLIIILIFKFSNSNSCRNELFFHWKKNSGRIKPHLLNTVKSLISKYSMAFLLSFCTFTPETWV